MVKQSNSSTDESSVQRAIKIITNESLLNKDESGKLTEYKQRLFNGETLDDQVIKAVDKIVDSLQPHAKVQGN